jgi:hypothetical protein
VPQIQPELLYAIIAVLVAFCMLLGLAVGGYLLTLAAKRARDSKFGNPDAYVMNEVKNRITRQRREAAVDALIEELKPGEVVADE